MKWEQAALNGVHDLGHGEPLTTFEADFRLMRAGAYRCACGEPATGLHRARGRTLRECKLCRDIARQRSQVARMSSR